MEKSLIAIIIFLLAYALIISEKIHRTITALAGAILLILFHPLVLKPFCYFPIRQSACFSCVYSNPPEFLFGQISIHSLKGN